MHARMSLDGLEVRYGTLFMGAYAIYRTFTLETQSPVGLLCNPRGIQSRAFSQVDCMTNRLDDVTMTRMSYIIRCLRLHHKEQCSSGCETVISLRCSL